MTFQEEKLLNMFRLGQQVSTTHVHFYFVLLSICLDVRKHANPNTTIVLVGNKCDLKSRARQVTKEEGEKFARDNGIPLFIETSAKSAENVEEVFAKTAEDVYDKIKSGVFSPNEVKQNPPNYSFCLF